MFLAVIAGTAVPYILAAHMGVGAFMTKSYLYKLNESELIALQSEILDLMDNVHTVFKPVGTLVNLVERRLTEKGYDFDRFDWTDVRGSNGSPVCYDKDNGCYYGGYTDDPDVVVVLEVTLATLQETFEFAWQWIEDGQEDSWRSEGLMATPDRLKLIEGSESFQPFTIRWRLIKLDAGMGMAPESIRDPEMTPGLALLFAAAQHPARVKAIDNEERFGWFIPGLKCPVPGHEGPWHFVPYLSFDPDTRTVKIDTDWCGNERPDLAAPIFWE